ncbi:spermatogenesis-associated serine-rich protein 2 isoform X2 [Microcaecilia unicolor]|uniref:Spermatogenesis-associated serine-rich protein 2 isoform X2 n=1 Tax=Microcaecilia unicolor TaxID=1415580 RepID=A0A6P7XQI3_9AMPH|nr:spermatogenesis-associated serine-rich protein 2 isoform X2 [Microcaecilia unicolor]XP_030052665.1 spermatogenesis-associated serine-rich protein 2 isoform X2 [Microcaecilia unicolor]XP_030052666.1 spermatogenesis-associated serine-rich protein 2 isoform X2 [Microcaecilia unicolor]
MSKTSYQKDPAGFVFDVQSNTVMAQGGSSENMKEKINAVRAIIPNRSNNEIILVLQYFDNCVDKTVQAFMEGNACEVLKEWTVTGKKKNKKKKSKPKASTTAASSPANGSKEAPNEGEQSATPSEKGGMNGYINGSVNDTESVDSLSEGLDTLSIDARELEECESSTLEAPDVTASGLENGKLDLELKLPTSLLSQSSQPSRSPSHEHKSAQKSRSGSIVGSQASSFLCLPEDSTVPSSNRKLGANIEKSVKDLQRCAVSLARYRVVVKEEMDASIKKMKQSFAELQSCLMDQEVALLAEMDKVKVEAMEILDSRQKKAEELKRMTDVAVRMSEEQLSELRADIKHFVSERKYDEDLGRAARFTGDVDTLKKGIESFGQVSHPKNSYSTRSRCNSTTSSSEICANSISRPDSASTTSLTAPSKKPITTASTTTSHASSRPNQTLRQVFQGNRRPGQGYLPQSQRQPDFSTPGRPENMNRSRTNSRYGSGNRYQGFQARPPGHSSECSQQRTPETNGTAVFSESSQSALSSPAAFSQRKSRNTQIDTVTT